MDVAPFKWQTQLELERTWRSQWLLPITHALYEQDYDQAQHLLQLAEEALPLSDLPADVREALGYYLKFSVYHLDWQRDPALWNAQSYAESMRFFEAPAKTAFGDRERLLRWITIRCVADQDKFDPLTRQEITGLLERMRDDPELNYVMHYIATWAFIQRDVELMELAFTEHLINPSSMLGGAKWQRINLMYQLLQNKATRRDVEETLSTIKIRPQLLEFTDLLWPVCAAQGLIDAELERQLADVRQAVELDGAVPEPEPRSKSFRSVKL